MLFGGTAPFDLSTKLAVPGALKSEQIEMPKTVIYDPFDTYSFGNADWFTFIEHVPTGIIAGFYTGTVKNNVLTHSYIQLHPDFINKHLCTPFVTDTYKYIIAMFDLTILRIPVYSENSAAASSCYFKRAKAYNLVIFDCKLGNFVDDLDICKINLLKNGCMYIFVNKAHSLDNILDRITAFCQNY